MIPQRIITSVLLLRPPPWLVISWDLDPRSNLTISLACHLPLEILTPSQIWWYSCLVCHLLRSWSQVKSDDFSGLSPSSWDPDPRSNLMIFLPRVSPLEILIPGQIWWFLWLVTFLLRSWLPVKSADIPASCVTSWDLDPRSNLMNSLACHLPLEILIPGQIWWYSCRFWKAISTVASPPPPRFV